MVRVTHTPTIVPSPFAATPVIALPFTAADATNKEEFVHTGDQMIIAQNTGAGSRNITITSTPDPYGRSQDVTAFAMAAGTFAVTARFPITGWRQSNGKLYFEASHAEVKFAVIDLQNQLVARN